MILIDIIRVPLLHRVRLDNDGVSSNHAVSKTFVSTVFPPYNNIVSRIMSNADDFIHFRLKIETYIRSLATSKNPRHNRPTMTRTLAYVLRPISSSPTFLLPLRRHRKQAASGWCGCPKMSDDRCIFFEHQRLSQTRIRRPRGNACVQMRFQASSRVVDGGMNRALTAVTQPASSRQSIRKSPAQVLEESNTWAEGASGCESSNQGLDQNHGIEKETYTTIKVSSLLCTEAATQ